MFISALVGLILMGYIFIVSYFLGKSWTNVNFLILKKYKSDFITGMILFLIINISIIGLINVFTPFIIYKEVGIICINAILLFYIFGYYYKLNKLTIKNSKKFLIEKFYDYNFIFKSILGIVFLIIYYSLFKYLKINSTIYALTNDSQFDIFFSSLSNLFNFETDYFYNYIFPIFIIYFTINIVGSSFSFLRTSYTRNYLLDYALDILLVPGILVFAFIYNNFPLFLTIILTTYSLIILLSGVQHLYQKSSKIFFASMVFLLNYYDNHGILILWLSIGFSFFIYYIFTNINFALNDFSLFLSSSIIAIFFEIIQQNTFTKLGDIIGWVVFFLIIIFFVYLFLYNSIIFRFFKSFSKTHPWILTITIIMMFSLWSYINSGQYPWEKNYILYDTYKFIPLNVNLSTWVLNIMITSGILFVLVILTCISFIYTKFKTDTFLRVTSYYLMLIIFLLNPIAIDMWSNILFFINWNDNSSIFNHNWNPFSIFMFSIFLIALFYSVYNPYNYLYEKYNEYKNKKVFTNIKTRKINEN